MRPKDKGTHYDGIFRNKFNKEVYLVLWCPDKNGYSFTVVGEGKGLNAKKKGDHFYHVKEHIKYVCEKVPKILNELKYKEIYENLKKKQNKKK